MPITFVNQGDMPADVTGTLYPNHAQALAYRPITTFRSKSASSTGVFPDEPLSGSGIADTFHIHQIAFAGVVNKICVTFLKGGAHASWIFYWPSLTASSTFNRTVRGRVDDTMKDEADKVAEEFIGTCATIPAITANELVVAFLNAQALAKRQNEELGAAKKLQAVPVSTSLRDQKLFNSAPVASDKKLSASEVDAVLKDYVVAFGLGEEAMVRRCLLNGTPRSEWNRFASKHYEGIFGIVNALGSSSSTSPSP
jgi:hypothetical protein